MEKQKKLLRAAAALLAVFALWTAAVCVVDVQAIGPHESSVGFASLNGFFHRAVGVHLALYTATDWLSLIPLLLCAGFGILGLAQWVRRRSLAKVDASLLALGGFYMAVLAAFMLFEVFPVNYRPVLLDGQLEASYPSSTTLLTLCALPTAIMQFNGRIKQPALRRFVTLALTLFTAFMVIGRLISGVHWLTDIIGGALLSAGLVTLYAAVICTQ